MTLLAFTIPDDPAQLASWLERRLVAPDFGSFVAELAAVYPERGRSRLPARQLLGDWYRKALIEGLNRIPVGLLQQLLRQPHTLLEFQEAVLAEGGTFWDELASRNDELAPALERGKKALEAKVGATTSSPQVGGFTSPTPHGRGGVGEGSSRHYRTWALVSSALAACLLLAIGVMAFRDSKTGQPVEVAAVNWGWAKPGGIPQASPKPAEYLNSLASTANEWFDKRPDDAAGVAKRINELRTGCSQLIFSSHSVLAQADRDWLIEKCRVWAKKLDDHLTALENGAAPLTIRGDADETIRKLQGALRERASQLG